MSNELLKTAIGILSEAASLDANKQPNNALLKYTDGIEKLMSYMRTLNKDDPRRDHFKERITEYVNRAEILKKEVRFDVDILEQRKIAADSTGHSYESVFSKCLDDRLTIVSVQDAYIIAHHQILNFIRFCELLVRMAKNLIHIELKTSTDAKNNQEAFKELEASLKSRNIQLKVSYESNIHDREIRFNNGWIVKIGRGLDYFKNPGKYAIGACDMSLRKCHETTIDIFKVKLS